VPTWGSSPSRSRSSYPVGFETKRRYAIAAGL
jgi:hypothetical protein